MDNWFYCRNLNTIRAVARTHGDPLDRPAYMARYAQGCIYRLRRCEYFQSIKWLVRRLHFDYHFLKMSLNFWFIRAYLNVLSAVGLAPKNAADILNYSPDAWAIIIHAVESIQLYTYYLETFNFHTKLLKIRLLLIQQEFYSYTWFTCHIYIRIELHNDLRIIQWYVK